MALGFRGSMIWGFVFGFIHGFRLRFGFGVSGSGFFASRLQGSAFRSVGFESFRSKIQR